MRVIRPRRRARSMQKSTLNRVSQIARIRGEIADGNYESPDRLASAIEAFLREEDEFAADSRPDNRPTHRLIRANSFSDPSRPGRLRLVRA